MSNDLDWSVGSPSSGVDDGRLAVVAHALLGGVAAVRGAVELAANTEPANAHRDSLLALAVRRLDVMTEQLRNLAAGVPQDALTFLADPNDTPWTVDLRAGTRIEVHNSFSDTWTCGFEIAEAVIGGYRVRRASDSSVLAGLVASDDIRVAPQRSSPHHLTS